MDPTDNDGDEVEDHVSQLQELADEVDLDSAMEEDPLTLDPSTSLQHSLLFPLQTPSNTFIFSPGPIPLRPP